MLCDGSVVLRTTLAIGLAEEVDDSRVLAVVKVSVRLDEIIDDTELLDIEAATVVEDGLVDSIVLLTDANTVKLWAADVVGTNTVLPVLPATEVEEEVVVATFWVERRVLLDNEVRALLLDVGIEVTVEVTVDLEVDNDVEVLISELCTTDVLDTTGTTVDDVLPIPVDVAWLVVLGDVETAVLEDRPLLPNELRVAERLLLCTTLLELIA